MSTTTAIVKARRLSTDVSLEQARAELHQARQRAQQRLAALKAEVSRATDFRAIVRRHPIATAAAAVAVGYLVYSLIRRR